MELLTDHRCPNPNHAKRMISRLRGRIAEHGPEFDNEEKVKHLEDGIYEFREQPSRGPKPRVYFFRDDSRVICTEAFMKRNENINRFIQSAKELRTQYQQGKRANQIEIDIDEEIQ